MILPSVVDRHLFKNSTLPVSIKTLLFREHVQPVTHLLCASHHTRPSHSVSTAPDQKEHI